MNKLAGVKLVCSYEAARRPSVNKLAGVKLVCSSRAVLESLELREEEWLGSGGKAAGWSLGVVDALTTAPLWL
jgi:hypothetical protein